MADIVYKYDDVPTIKSFSECDKFLVGLMGPFGSGKSSGCVIQLVKLADKQNIGNDGKKHARFAVIRNTYPQLKDTTIKTFLSWLPEHLFGKYNKTDHDYIIDRLDPNMVIEVMFRALDRPEHVSNLLSLELTGAWVNEAREVPWAVIQALQGRVGRFPAIKDGGCVGQCIIMDTNPPDTDSWWYELFEDKKPDNATIFKQPGGLTKLAENKSFLPVNYYENMLSGMDADTAKVYVHGEYGFIKDGKPVYPEYNDSIHCVDIEVVPKIKIYRGWDFGLTPACVFSQLLPSGRWNTFDELCADGLGIDRFGNAVIDHCGINYSGYEFVDIGDPAGEQRAQTDEKTCFELLRAKGISIQAGEQTPEIRIGSVKRALSTMIEGKPVATVHSRCKILRKGYQGRYQYKRMKIAGSAERYHDTPDKNEYSHPHDANQYVAGRLFGALLRNSDKPVKPIAYPKRTGIV